MINVEDSTAILTALVEKFDARLKSIAELRLEADNALKEKEAKTDEKMARKLHKELAKIEKFVKNEDEKQSKKQVRLLNSNYLIDLEKEINQNVKLLASDDEHFIESLQDMFAEAKESQFVDELEFLIRYLAICENSTNLQLQIFRKQLEFIQKVFSE